MSGSFLLTITTRCFSHPDDDQRAGTSASSAPDADLQACHYRSPFAFTSLTAAQLTCHGGLQPDPMLAAPRKNLHGVYPPWRASKNCFPPPRQNKGSPRQIACFKPTIETRLEFASEHFVSISRKSCCRAIMKKPIPKNWRAKLMSVLFVRLTLENWRAKLISVLLATMLWYLIKKNVATTSSPSERPSGTPITETR